MRTVFNIFQVVITALFIKTILVAEDYVWMYNTNSDYNVYPLCIDKKGEIFYTSAQTFFIIDTLGNEIIKKTYPNPHEGSTWIDTYPSNTQQ